MRGFLAAFSLEKRKIPLLAKYLICMSLTLEKTSYPNSVLLGSPDLQSWYGGQNWQQYRPFSNLSGHQKVKKQAEGPQVRLGRAWLPYFYKGDKPGIPDVVLLQQVGQLKDVYIVGHVLPDCPDLLYVLQGGFVIFPHFRAFQMPQKFSEEVTELNIYNLYE